ncbi:tetraspanin-8-like [Impatiens glandulifera]|uniref:tetraspanin-8-like n=1 Tax=Impatiens glandulifera TaxID=253017 RepID=UPI001FB07837|nr:tetraspanin-8-like [Impatiens glandulifera]
MVRLSNCIAALINVVIILIAVVLIGTSMVFYKGHGSATECERFLQKPLLAIGIFLFVLSILGLGGATCRFQWMLWIHLFVMFLLIIVLTAFTVFVIVVTNSGVGRAVSGRGFKEYRLGDYNDWLQKNVINDDNWIQIRSCLIDTRACRHLQVPVSGQTLQQFININLTPVESGCCKPPIYCELDFKNATFWTMPKTGPAVPDEDCVTWNNDPKKLCFDCKSCKAGVLSGIKKEWKIIAIINSCFIGFVIIFYSIGCCALRANRVGRYHKYRP